MKFLSNMMGSYVDNNDFVFYFFPELLVTLAFVIYFSYKILTETVFKHQVQELRIKGYSLFFWMVSEVKKVTIGVYFLKQIDLILSIKRKFFPARVEDKVKKEKGTKNLDLLFLALVCFCASFLLFQLFCSLVNLGVRDEVFFYGMYEFNSFTVFMKMLISILFFIFFVISFFVSPYWVYYSFEFVALLYISMIAMFAMVSANDFFLLFLSLEVQTLVIVLIAAYQSNVRSSIEAGLKYFILSAFFSGLFLFAISLIYVVLGTTEFQIIFKLTSEFGVGSKIREDLFLLASLIILGTLLFKLGVVPYHYWIPDLYRGSHLLVTAFLAVLSKIAIITITLKIFNVVYYTFFGEVSYFLFIVAIASMFLGNWGAMYENDLRRFIGYTSINNFGIMLMGLALGGDVGITSAFFLIITYLFSNLVFLLAVLGIVIKEPLDKLTEKEEALADSNGYLFLNSLNDFKGMYKTNKLMSLGLILALFGLMSVPPFLFFFGKLGVLKVALALGEPVAFSALVGTSLFSAWYYLRIIRLIFLDRETNIKAYFFSSRTLGFIFYVLTIMSLILVLYPAAFEYLYQIVWAVFGFEIRAP